MSLSVLNQIGFNFREQGGMLFSNPDLYNSLNALAKTGVNSVTICWEMDNNASAVSNNWRSSKQDVINAIDYAYKIGFQVTLNPIFQGLNGSWSGTFVPTNIDSWFKSYGDLMVEYATMAQQHHVAQFFLTNEAGKLNTDPQYLKYWSEIITRVRSVYSGQVGVNANWNNQEVFNLTYGKLLDFIGVSAYEPLTNQLNPSQWQIEQAWLNNITNTNYVSEINRIHNIYNLPVEISEIQFPSISGSTIYPNNTDLKKNTDGNYGAQTNAYLATIAAMEIGTGDWFKGITFYAWYPSLTPDKVFGPRGYIFQDNSTGIQTLTSILNKSNLSYIGSSVDQFFLGSKGIDQITYPNTFKSYQISNNPNYILVDSPRTPEIINIQVDFARFLTGKANVPNISILVNGVVQVQPTPITVDDGGKYQSSNISLSAGTKINSLQLITTNTSYSDSSNFSNVQIKDISVNGIYINLNLAKIINGGNNNGTPFVNSGSLTLDSSAFSINTTNASNYLIGIERLNFADKSLAFDLLSSQSAGQTAEILGAAFGTKGLNNQQYLGIGINLFDAGLNMNQIAQLAINTGLVSASDNTSFVKAVWSNVMGSSIDSSNLNTFVNLLNNGTFTQANLLATAAASTQNQSNINLVGLALTGLPYTPVPS